MKCEFQNSCRELCANQPLFEMQALDWGQLEDQAEEEDSDYILQTEGSIKCAGYIVDNISNASEPNTPRLDFCQAGGTPPRITTILDPLVAGFSLAQAFVEVTPLPNVPRQIERPHTEKSA